MLCCSFLWGPPGPCRARCLMCDNAGRNQRTTFWRRSRGNRAASVPAQIWPDRAARGGEPRAGAGSGRYHLGMANRLADETSPYLLQHAHNPVDWYPWGPEALARAREENKPIFLSIGYAACHWCHVMERESFEDAATAEDLNRDFVAVKVDREERPDLDQVYMAAVQAMTGQGGWPMSIFLTPDGKPFYGGTYFPPQPAHGMPAFRQVLAGVARARRGPCSTRRRPRSRRASMPRTAGGEALPSSRSR